MSDATAILNDVLSALATDHRVEANGLLNQIQHDFEVAWSANQD
jgi:hypothetical protein